MPSWERGETSFSLRSFFCPPAESQEKFYLDPKTVLWYLITQGAAKSGGVWKMAIDWPKVLEVFGSGIIGVFVVMLLLMVLTQLSTVIIDRIENWSKAVQPEPGPEAKPQVAVAKDK
jgi:hypothetical protein